MTIPSQIRYVHYFAQILKVSRETIPEPRTLLLKSVELHTIPKVPHVAGNHHWNLLTALDIRFSVYVAKTLVYTHKDPPKLKKSTKKKSKAKEEEADEEESLTFECTGLPICGDVKLEFYEKETFGSVLA